MTEIEFGELPPKKGGPRWYEIAEALRAKPGAWALVRSGIYPSAPRSIKRGLLVAFRPAGSFDAVMRSVKDGRGDLWARYIGENGEHA